MANELYMSEAGFRHFWSKLDTILDNKVEKTQAATDSVLGLVIPGTGLNNASGTISVKYSTTAQAGFADRYWYCYGQWLCSGFRYC